MTPLSQLRSRRTMVMTTDTDTERRPSSRRTSMTTTTSSMSERPSSEPTSFGTRMSSTTDKPGESLTSRPEPDTELLLPRSLPAERLRSLDSRPPLSREDSTREPTSPLPTLSSTRPSETSSPPETPTSLPSTTPRLVRETLIFTVKLMCQAFGKKREPLHGTQLSTLLLHGEDNTLTPVHHTDRLGLE